MLAVCVVLALSCALAGLGGPRGPSAVLASVYVGPTRGPHAVDLLSSDGHIMVAHGDPLPTLITGYDADSGEVRWRRSPGGRVMRGMLVRRHLLYALMWHHGVYVLSAKDGVVRAHLPTGESGVYGILFTPRLVIVNTTVRARGLEDWSDSLVAYELETLRPVWRHVFVAGRVVSLGRATDHTLHVWLHTDTHGFVDERVALDLEDGRLKTYVPWEGMKPRFEADQALLDMLPPPARETVSGLFKGSGSWRGPLVRLGNLVFVGGREDCRSPTEVIAVRIDDGRVAWRHRVPGLEYEGIAAAGHTVAALYRQGTQTTPALVTIGLIGLNAETGGKVWENVVEKGTTATREEDVRD